MFYAWANHNKARKCHFPFAKRILWNWNCGISHTVHTHYTHSHTCSHSHAVRSKRKPYVSEALCCSSHKHRKFFRFVGSREVCVRIGYPMITYDTLWYPQDTLKIPSRCYSYKTCIKFACLMRSSQRKKLQFCILLGFLTFLPCSATSHPLFLHLQGISMKGKKVNLASVAIDDGVVDIYITTTSCMLCG